jgi:hypothetical protein
MGVSPAFGGGSDATWRSTMSSETGRASAIDSSTRRRHRGPRSMPSERRTSGEKAASSSEKSGSRATRTRVSAGIRGSSGEPR